MPFPGAGSIYTSAEDLAKFVRFNLNLGRVNGRQLLDSRYLLEMYRPLFTPDYGLGVAIIDQDGKLVFNHNGGGFGWQASMTWFPRHGVGCVVLANKQTSADLYGLTTMILDDWIKYSNILNESTRLPFDPVSIGKSLAQTAQKPPPCQGDTLFQTSWIKYEGAYRLRFGPGFKFTWYAKLARMLGYRVAKIEVHRRDKGLLFRLSYGNGYGDWQRLTEYRPGLFFTEYGEVLDLRKTPPTYRNITLER